MVGKDIGMTDLEWIKHDKRIKYIFEHPFVEIYICLDNKFHSWGVLRNGYWYFRTVKEPTIVTRLVLMDSWFNWGIT